MYKSFILFSCGGIFYLTIEMLWRGYSHWSMFILGGVCFSLIGLLNEKCMEKIPVILQMMMGAVVITALEFVTGYILNIKLHMNVWSYSDMPFNIMGQVCLPYMILWFFMSLACILMDDFLRQRLFDMPKRQYRWF